MQTSWNLRQQFACHILTPQRVWCCFGHTGRLSIEGFCLNSMVPFSKWILRITDSGSYFSFHRCTIRSVRPKSCRQHKPRKHKQFVVSIDLSEYLAWSLMMWLKTPQAGEGVQHHFKFQIRLGEISSLKLDASPQGNVLHPFPINFDDTAQK